MPKDHMLTPDWSYPCEVCGEVPTMGLTQMCGPCTFGEAETAGGNWNDDKPENCPDCEGMGDCPACEADGYSCSHCGHTGSCPICSGSGIKPKQV